MSTIDWTHWEEKDHDLATCQCNECQRERARRIKFQPNGYWTTEQLPEE